MSICNKMKDRSSAAWRPCGFPTSLSSRVRRQFRYMDDSQARPKRMLSEVSSERKRKQGKLGPGADGPERSPSRIPSA